MLLAEIGLFKECRDGATFPVQRLSQLLYGSDKDRDMTNNQTLVGCLTAAAAAIAITHCATTQTAV